jgi:hypothetical protein
LFYAQGRSVGKCPARFRGWLPGSGDGRRMHAGFN